MRCVIVSESVARPRQAKPPASDTSTRIDHANPQTPAQKVAKFRQHIRTEIGTAGVHRIGDIQYRMIPERCRTRILDCAMASE
jgi:hypothetical protein